MGESISFYFLLRIPIPFHRMLTTNRCCPQGYTCGANGGFQTCHQVATKTSFDAMTCEGLSGSNLDAFKVPGTLAGETVTTMDLWAPMIQINHMTTDLPETSATESAVKSTETAESSRSRTKSGKGAEPTQTGAPDGDEIARGNDVEEEPRTSEKASKTRTSEKAKETEADMVARVKDVKEEPESTSAEEEKSKAAKTTSAEEKQHKASATRAPSTATPTPTIDWSQSAVAAGEPKGILFDTRPAPSMASTLWPSATVALESAASTSDAAAPQSFSTGAKVGVACAPVGAAALILIGVFALRRRRRNTNSTDGSDAKSIGSGSTGASSYQSTYFGGNASSIHVHESGTARRLTVDAYPPASAQRSPSPYNEDRVSHEMAMNGPGPAVVAPAGYGTAANKMTPADFYANPWTDKDEYETRPFETPASRFKHAHAQSFSDDSSMDSPIDGASPFRLKRKSTLKGREPPSKRLTGQANNLRHISMEGSIVTPTPDDHRTSQDSSDGDFDTMKRSNSFSRPRPRGERPLTTASSVYPVDRDSVMSWDDAMAPDMPDKPLPSIPEKGVGVGGEWRAGVYPVAEEDEGKSEGSGTEAPVASSASPGLDRSKSFSRPRPKRDPAAEVVVQVEGEGRATTPVPKGVVAPPVTAEGVSF